MEGASCLAQGEMEVVEISSSEEGKGPECPGCKVPGSGDLLPAKASKWG